MPTSRTTQRSLRRCLAKQVFGGYRALGTRGLPARVVTAALAVAALSIGGQESFASASVPAATTPVPAATTTVPAATTENAISWFGSQVTTLGAY